MKVTKIIKDEKRQQYRIKKLFLNLKYLHKPWYNKQKR